MLAAKRLRAHLALFAALVAIVAVVTGFSSAIAGYLSGAALSGVRESIAGSTGQDGAFRVQVRLGDDAGSQDEAVRTILADAFEDAPLLVDRTLQSDPVTLPDGGEVTLASIEDLESRATLDSGGWASAAGEAVLQADAAASLGLDAGDTITLPSGAELDVVGTWHATDPQDPFWFGEADVHGPLVIEESGFAGLDTVPFARWVARPDPALVEPSDLAALASGPATAREPLEESDEVGTTNVLLDGSLAELAGELSRSTSAVAGVAPVPALLVAASGALTLLELARLLTGVRTIETSLLRSRGASARRLTALAAAEAAAAAVPGAAIGSVVAAVVVGAWSWVIPAAVVVGTVILFAGVAFVEARRPARRETAQDSGRASRVAGFGLVLVVTVAAAVAVWQLRLYGSPVVQAADGRYVVDPIAVLAPTLALVSLALLAVVLFGRVSAALQGSGRGSIGWTLPARQVARRAAVFTTPVLLIALAVGGLGIAATYSATWENDTVVAREASIGTDVRVTGRDLDPAYYETLDGVDDAAPAVTADLLLGDAQVALVSLDRESIAPVVSAAGGTVDTAAIADAMTSTDAIVVSRSLAERGSLAVGDPLTLRFTGSGREIAGSIGAIVDVIPGAGDGFGIMVDRAALDSGLEPNEVWIATAEPAAVAALVAGPGIRVRADAGANSLLGSGAVALWIGAIGGLVLAGAALSAVVGALLRGRTGEVVVLRVVGITARQQASMRRRELLIVVAYATVAGLVAGLGVSLLVVPDLARSTVIDPPAALAGALLVDPLRGGILLVGFLIAVTIIVAVYARRVLGQARTLSVREDVR